ncbi:MAG: SOS response-associated peptidase [Chitinophagaceae bacterium]
MCFHSKQTKKAVELEHRFRARFEKPEAYQPSIFNGFQFPKTPVITNLQPEQIQLLNWGLIPHWAKDKDIRKNTLNARIETIAEKPSFRNVIHQRCLVLVDGFYEWQWLDPEGKKKQKYEIGLADGEAFALGGLWSKWIDKETGEELNTYAILTTEARGLMTEIHNSKNRMPVIIQPGKENAWLSEEINETADPPIIATRV